MNTTDQATPRPHGPFFDVGCHVLKGGFRVAECHTPLAATQITDAMNAYDRLQRVADAARQVINEWSVGDPEDSLKLLDEQVSLLDIGAVKEVRGE